MRDEYDFGGGLPMPEDIAELKRLLRAERLLLNVLAVIHRDGGHYVDEHGVVKAAADGELVVRGLQDSARALRELLGEAK